ncbi:MAG: hypothetical protein MPJ24_11165 [Pirellulaceae bacterium]|nr:hypothetical protein [Pirellulaceae bacterium]
MKFKKFFSYSFVSRSSVALTLVFTALVLGGVYAVNLYGITSNKGGDLKEDVVATVEKGPKEGIEEGNQKLHQAIFNLQNIPNFMAKMNLVSRAYQENMVGTGFYVQDNSRQTLRYHYNLSLQVSQRKRYDFRQVNEGHFLWTQVVAKEKLVSKSNLTKIQRRLMETGRTQETALWYRNTLGGLPRLLFSLEQHFDFVEIKNTPSNDVDKDGTTLLPHGGSPEPVFLEGHWKVDKIGYGQPEAAKKGAVNLALLPPYLTSKVRVTLVPQESGDLFPVKVEFFQKPDTPGGELMASIELYDIQYSVPVGEEYFQFHHSDGDILVQELTDEVLKNWGVDPQGF